MAPAVHARIPGGIRLRLRVQPKSRLAGPQGYVAEPDGGMALKFGVNAAPEDGKVNAAIVALLARLGKHIRRPFWAFSNVVAPAVIRDNRLHADTTGGTSMGCVLAHVARTRPKAAIVVTDGYVEPIARAQVEAAAATRLHVVLTRDGSATQLQRAGLPYTQLLKVPS